MENRVEKLFEEYLRNGKMKILLVDDESKKLKRLHSVINTVDDLRPDSIDHVLDLKSAKNKMKSIRYELVVLDLKIAECIGEEDDSEIAGLEFIDEILETDSILTPKDIIILTEHDALQEKCVELRKNLEFPILKYDEQSIEWENFIKNKIRYQLKYLKSIECFSDVIKCDIAIICAVDNEMEALKFAFQENDFKRVNFDCDTTDYYLADIKANSKNIKVVYAQQREMGMAAASILSLNLVHHFHPQYLIMVGIAAGIGSGKNLGDIIVATEVWNYSSGKYITGENGEIVFSPDPKHIILDSGIESILKRDYAQQLFGIKRGFYGQTINHDLNLVFGPLACGAAVIGNSKIVDDMIKQHSRKTVGLDMESYGMFFAANYGINKCVIPICLKAISDFADEKKGDNFQKYASYTSCEFAKYLIENVLEYNK